MVSKSLLVGSTGGTHCHVALDADGTVRNLPRPVHLNTQTPGLPFNLQRKGPALVGSAGAAVGRLDRIPDRDVAFAARFGVEEAAERIGECMNVFWCLR